MSKSALPCRQLSPGSSTDESTLNYDIVEMSLSQIYTSGCRKLWGRWEARASLVGHRTTEKMRNCADPRHVGLLPVRNYGELTSAPALPFIQY